MGLTTFQIILIVCLTIIGPAGFWNMMRLKKKKAEDEFMGADGYNLSQTPDDSQNNVISNISPEIETQVKQYIEQYKSTYPKESIQQGILAYNISADEAKMLTDKYF